MAQSCVISTEESSRVSRMSVLARSCRSHFSTDAPSRTELLPQPCGKCSANCPAHLPSLSCHSNSSGCAVTLLLGLHTEHKPCHGDDCKYC